VVDGGAFTYRIEYGWPGLRRQATILETITPLELGRQLELDGHWWRVVRIVQAKPGDEHSGFAICEPA
jgi:hypothetical protein